MSYPRRPHLPLAIPHLPHLTFAAKFLQTMAGSSHHRFLLPSPPQAASLSSHSVGTPTTPTLPDPGLTAVSLSDTPETTDCRVLLGRPSACGFFGPTPPSGGRPGSPRCLPLPFPSVWLHGFHGASAQSASTARDHSPEPGFYPTAFEHLKPSMPKAELLISLPSLGARGDKTANLPVLSVRFSGFKYIHSVVQPSPLFISRTLPSSETETLDPLSNII